jgi:hypothetical protein
MISELLKQLAEFFNEIICVFGEEKIRVITITTIIVFSIRVFLSIISDHNSNAISGNRDFLKIFFVKLRKYRLFIGFIVFFRYFFNIYLLKNIFTSYSEQLLSSGLFKIVFKKLFKEKNDLNNKKNINNKKSEDPKIIKVFIDRRVLLVFYSLAENTVSEFYGDIMYQNIYCYNPKFDTQLIA